MSQDTNTELKEALKKDFRGLLVKEFTTDWQIQRLKIEIDIDVMSFDNLEALFKSQNRALLDELLKKTEHRIGIDGIRREAVPIEAIETKRGEL